ncbi:MAG: hypothetical protein PHU25_09775 [Deltaproteobacteria bacterium]|nr:hypothetical protein [Deltaproteobacteria bacterium]
MPTMIRYASLAFVAAACSGTPPRDLSPMYQGPLARSEWQGPTLENRIPDGKPSDSKGDVRARMRALALELLDKRTGGRGYGAEDLGRMMGEAMPKVRWRPSEGLDALVAAAKKKGAFASSGEPLPGDIVLFHNQWDANANGEDDDWLTGCGVVVDVSRMRFDAVVRTDHEPRRATVSPEDPSSRKEGGTISNSYLRVPRRSDARDTTYLAGQLYAGRIDVERLAAGAKP